MFGSERGRSNSLGSDEGSLPGKGNGKPLEEPILIYHESARSIVFRDHLRRAVKNSNENGTVNNVDHEGSVTVERGRVPSERGVAGEVEEYTHLAQEIFDPSETARPLEAGLKETQIAGFQPRIVPLSPLELGPNDEYLALMESTYDDGHMADFSEAEREVCEMLQQQKCTVKTIKNVDWTPFLQRFQNPVSDSHSNSPREHADHAADGDQYPFNSFVTSCSMLPTNGLKMRCYGSPNQYTVGVIFALPNEYLDAAAEDEAAARTQTWSWPAGYSAKTEFNIDSRGRLINGRQEALRPLSVLRQYNDEYVNKEEYMVGNRMISGLSQIPYNEIFMRVGGLGRLVRDREVSSGLIRHRSFDHGVGLPVALFVRTATYGHLISLLRTKARLSHVWGEEHIKNIPLLYISPAHGVRVLTESLQRSLWKLASSNLTPFQNSTIAHKTTTWKTDEQSFQQKVEELLDFDDSIREMLTPEELARLAGGFGATDDSVASVLQHVMIQDVKSNKQRQGDGEEKSEGSHKLQDVVNEGLAAAVRSGDYHTSRQLLMLYSLVASQADKIAETEDTESIDCGSVVDDGSHRSEKKHNSRKERPEIMKDLELVKRRANGTLSTGNLPAPPPPPPLDTDRLRSATNSDGLLAVLGAAQVLKAMQNGGAKKRCQEAVAAVEEWVNYGEQSMAFRIASWYDQRAAQGDLKIATEDESKFMAFVSNKAISNRKNFAQQLKAAVENTDFSDFRFLLAIDEILSKMHSPCLRLELLQYVLGLDNRYSVAHVIRSVELAAACLGIASAANAEE